MATKTPASAPGPPAPSGPPPPGGDQNRGEDIIITQFVLISIATILVGLRIWVRSRMTRKIGWDDILITMALRKFGICALMGLGYFSGVCAIVRTVISMKVFKAGGLADFSWVIIDLRIWGTVENLAGIIAASIPTLKPLYVKQLGSHYLPWSKGGSSKQGYVAHSEETPNQRHHIRPPKDPYATTLTTAAGSTETAQSYPHAQSYGHHEAKLADQINVRTDIELDDYHDQRPMVRKGHP
ncbi:MAG: hypothetical protein L6R38_008266 [Xanthoria sp. 2 TBL-2021]|nr:MAG: hypothetical protein L6R38_008266 [Xanthoria sp. 2 TBL-2021]